MHRLAIIYNGKSLAKWQRTALELVSDEYEFFFLVPESQLASPKRLIKNFLYYVINLLSIRNSQSRLVPFDEASDKGDRTFGFVPEYRGNWAMLPAAALNWLAEKDVSAVIKFDLGLLQIPDEAPPVLSFHHGDPKRYRGRPAGFYEHLAGEAFIGQIVQRLTNSLDAGEILAFAETRVHPHSYRRTLTEAYALSPYLLRPALRALHEGRAIDHPVEGKVFRLPSNAVVVRMLARAAMALAKRLLYGAFFEKRWRVSTTALKGEASATGIIAQLEANPEQWTNQDPPPGFTFLADPFFGRATDEILAEALEARTGKGRIVRLAGNSAELLQTARKHHLSYPGGLVENGVRYILPEMSRGGSQAAFVIDGPKLVLERELQIDAGPLLDPTFVTHEGRVYLFANLATEGSSILRLWSADSLFQPFSEHPDSPIRVSARGSRMAGEIAHLPEGLVRYGQDVRRSYGDGVLAFLIERLSPDSYLERPLGKAAFNTVKGPHTINFMDGVAVFDWYDERFSPMAGVRRLTARLWP
jgi:hypothetical protein